jgi:hypothetical protein
MTVYTIPVGNSKGKEPPGRFRLKWEDNGKMDIKRSCYESVDWINLNLDSYK